MLNISHYQRNANQNYNEASFHIRQNDHHQKSTNNTCGEGVERKEPSCPVDGNANYYINYGEQYGDSLKNWK